MQATDLQNALMPSKSLPGSTGGHGALIQEQQRTSKEHQDGTEKPTGSVPEDNVPNTLFHLCLENKSKKYLNKYSRKDLTQKEHD